MHCTEEKEERIGRGLVSGGEAAGNVRGGPPGIFKFCIKQKQKSAAAGTGGGGKSAKNVNQEIEIRAYL